MYLMAVISKIASAPALSFALVAACAAIPLAVPARASDAAGTDALRGIALVPAARPAGLAGAHAAVAEGAASLGINPAGLARETGQHYSGSVSPDMVRMGAVAYTRPLGEGRLALGATYVDYGGILETDEEQTVLGVQRPFSLYPSASYARALGPRWRAGATLKLAREDLGDFEGARAAFGAGIDAGVQYQPAARNLGFGASVTNLGRKFTGHFEGDDASGALPAAARGGLFYHPAGRRLTVIADAVLPFHHAPALALGGEFAVFPEWILRAGTRWNAYDVRNLFGWLDPSSGIRERHGEALKLAGGTTLRVGPVGVDYAAQWWRDLGLVHSLTVAWAMDR